MSIFLSSLCTVPVSDQEYGYRASGEWREAFEYSLTPQVDIGYRLMPGIDASSERSVSPLSTQAAPATDGS